MPRKQPKIFCLLAVGSSQDTISSISEPAHFEPWSCNLLEPQSCTCGQKGLWRPRVDIGSNSLQAWNQLETKDHPAFLHITWIWLHSLSLGLTEEEEAQVAGNNELMEEEISGEKRPREDHRPSQRNTVFKHFYLAQPEAKCS